MERLTIDTKMLFCDISQCRETPGGSFCEDGYCDQRRCYERLREYERICDLDGLNELVKAKREGRLVVLPCKTWETVHEATKGNPLCSAADSEKSSFLHAKKPPVIHAHWTDKGSLSCRCSHCGCKSTDEFPYCPRCGARMDEETNI